MDASRSADPESRSASSVGGTVTLPKSNLMALQPRRTKWNPSRPLRRVLDLKPPPSIAHELLNELRPFRLDTRLLLRGLAVMADGSARRPCGPRFSAAVVDYVAAVPHDVGRVTLEAAPLRPGDAALSYRAADGAVLPDADPESVGLQVDLPLNEPTTLELTVSHGAQSRRYRVQLVRTGPPDGAAPCAEASAGERESSSQRFEVDGDRLVVPSTPEHYYVLYRAAREAGAELPVSISIGRTGTTILDPCARCGRGRAVPRRALPARQSRRHRRRLHR